MTSSLPSKWQKLRQSPALQIANQLRSLMVAVVLFSSLTGSAASPCEVIFSKGAAPSQRQAQASLTLSRVNECLRAFGPPSRT